MWVPDGVWVPSEPAPAAPTNWLLAQSGCSVCPAVTELPKPVLVCFLPTRADGGHNHEVQLASDGLGGWEEEEEPGQGFKHTDIFSKGGASAGSLTWICSR